MRWRLTASNMGIVRGFSCPCSSMILLTALTISRAARSTTACANLSVSDMIPCRRMTAAAEQMCAKETAWLRKLLGSSLGTSSFEESSMIHWVDVVADSGGRDRRKVVSAESMILNVSQDASSVIKDPISQ